MEFMSRRSLACGILFGNFSNTPMRDNTFLLPNLMSYKEECKNEGNELIIKLRIIREVVVLKRSQKKTSERYHMGRNTVGRLVKEFKEKIPSDIQEELLDSERHFSQAEIKKKLSPLKNKSRRPKGNKRSANPQQKEIILKYFHTKKVSVGVNRMWNFLQRRKVHLGNEPPEHLADTLILQSLTKAQLRGIYKRNGLKVKKKRTKNGNVRPLYDYNALASFERLHYDTKTIPDQQALPEEIYQKFKLNKELPIIEWNIIDVKSRFRFLAYSHERSSEFGLHFLLFTIQFIRAHTICPDMRIIIGTDNGSEFFSGSERKQKEWNQMLDLLNAEIYSYNPRFDVRKNLIERSHKTDDEEFFCPRGEFINNKKDFMLEASNYSHYFNALRSHSGICMNGKTPVEKLAVSGIYNAQKFLTFPTMILENHINDIKKATEIIRIIAFINNQNRTPQDLANDQRFCANLNANFKNLEKIAPNLLTQYQMGGFFEKGMCFFDK